MSHLPVQIDPLGQLAELVVHRIHAMKQKEKFKKFQPLKGPRENPYSREGSVKNKALQKHKKSVSQVEQGMREDQERSSMTKRSIIVTEDNLNLPKILFHQRSFEKKYKEELKEFQRHRRLQKQYEERQKSQSRIFDEVLQQEQNSSNLFPDGDYTSLNITVPESRIESKNSKIVPRQSKRSRYS